MITCQRASQLAISALFEFVDFHLHLRHALELQLEFSPICAGHVLDIRQASEQISARRRRRSSAGASVLAHAPA